MTHHEKAVTDKAKNTITTHNTCLCPWYNSSNVLFLLGAQIRCNFYK